MKKKSVNCTLDVSKTCRYGVSESHTLGATSALCNYMLITGCSRKCDPTACDKYEKIDENHPRRMKPLPGSPL